MTSNSLTLLKNFLPLSPGDDFAQQAPTGSTTSFGGYEVAHYLVTGGAGFIGSHLVDHLIAAGHRVRTLDNMSTGRRENVNPRAELIVGDIRHAQILRHAVDGMDGIFHLAAVASVEQSVKDWNGCHAVNLSATIALFDAAAKQPGAKKPKVVYASSAAIYGDNAIAPLAESCAPSPITPYGADKLGCEHHARSASLIHNVPSVGGRFFNVYGPRQDPSSPYSGVISIFIDRMLRGEGVTFFGDGGQVRDFIYVGDVVQWLMAAMANPKTKPQVYNVCTGRQTSIRTLAETIAIITGTELMVETKPTRSGDIRQSLGDPTQAQRQLGFNADVTLGMGLQFTIDAEIAERRVPEAANA